VIVRGHGLAVDAPAGWDVRIGRDPDDELAVLHLASFALPPSVGGFGGEAIDAMPDDGVVVSVLEYGADVSDAPLFPPRDRLPARFRLRDLDPAALTRGRPRRAGAQRFARVAGRPLCVYVVVGWIPSPARLLRAANRVLASVAVGPREP
jgi:hypothetical protein